MALLLSGCGPEELVIWSPDGSHALVKGSAGTYLVNASGSVLSKMPESEQWLDQPWMPDSRHVIVVRTVKAKSFDEYKSLLGESRSEAAYEAASKLLHALQTFDGKMDDFPFDAHNKAAESISATYLDGSALRVVCGFLMDRYPQEVAKLEAKFGVLTPDNGDLTPPIYELVIRNAIPFETPFEQVLLRSADNIHWVRSSPDGRNIAFVKLEPARPVLYAISTKGGSPIQVDDGAMQADWTLDGRGLVYTKTRLPYDLLDSDTHLGTITRRALCDEKGVLLSELPNPEDLAGIFFNPQGHVANLPDGRILFASVQLSLPAPPDATAKPSLFAVRIGETITIEPLLSPDVQRQLPDRPDLFSLSPDGKHVAIPGNAGGEVAILSLETGRLVKLQEQVSIWNSENRQKFGFIPTWRTATEICYIAPPNHPAASPHRSEVVLQSLTGKPRTLSKSWPDQMTNYFLRGLE